MKKIFTLLLAFACYVNSSNAQRYFGIANSNYAGINGLYINPANIADNRLKLDLQLVSSNAAINQNYGFIQSFKGALDSLNKGKQIAFTKNSSTDNVGFNVLAEVRGPAFMIQIDKKSAIGLLSRARVVGSGSGINTDYFTFINDGIRSVKLPNGTSFNSGNVNTSINAFSEIGLSYGREIMNQGKNYIKAGIIIKRYNGVAYSGAKVENFTVKLIDTSISKVEFNGTITASLAGNIDNINTNTILWGGLGSGFGVDIGAVYEFRDNGNDEDDEPISTLRTDNKYKLKVGFAIQDIGSMLYKKSSDIKSYSIKTNGPKIVSRVDTAQLRFQDFGTYFKSIGGTSIPDNEAISVLAPTVFTLYGDYKFKKHIYVNALFTGSLVGDNAIGAKMPFQVVVTPRYESKLFDAGLPISYNGLSKDIKIGVGLRIGIFFIGSDDLISSVTGISKLTSANVYTGLHIGFPYKKPKNKKEVEEEIPVPVKKEVPKKVETPAAPVDTDKDGVIDNEDKCPTVAGLKEFGGCPDTDGDGVPDSEDECPTEKGLKAFKGCPDMDGDGVPDKDDKCIDKAGPVENGGCPLVSEVVTKKLNFAAKAIQFQTGKDVLTPASFAQLDEVVQIMNEYKEYVLNIDGHTDNVGKADKNQLLSQARANAVLNYFTKKGIAAERLVATGFGNTKPLADNTTAANKAKNRRVELNMKLKD